MHYETIESISDAIKMREESIEGVVEHQLERISRLDPTLASFVHVDGEGARQRARELSSELAEGHWRGPLHGVPIAVKDLYGIAGQPFEIGMPSRAGMKADATATVAQRLMDAGAIVVGRLNLTEGVYAEHIRPFEAPKNPWNTDYWCGSSSSGSGVATAAGLAFGTLASDTGGSIRIPGSCNGVTGLKPTWGRASRYGAFELAATLDHPGPMARSAVDTGILLEAMAGYDPLDPTTSRRPVEPYGVRQTRSLDGWRIGVDLEWALSDITPATHRAILDAIDVFRGLGAEIVPVKFPDSDVIIDDWFKVCGVQTAYAHRDWFEGHKDSYGDALRALIELGQGVGGGEYQELILRRLNYTGRVIETLAPVDAMLIPGLPFEAPLAAEMVNMDEKKVTDIHRYTVPFTMSGLPTLTMPGGFATDPKLPVSIQLVASRFAERTLVTLGAAYQDQTPWNKEHPNLG